MARSGIYVNGKEIVARYFGDKLVWKKITWNPWITIGSVRSLTTLGDSQANFHFYITKDASRDYYPESHVQNCRIDIIHNNGGGTETITGVTVSFYYLSLQTDEGWFNKDLWFKCYMQLNFQNRHDLEVFKNAQNILITQLFKRG